MDDLEAIFDRLERAEPGSRRSRRERRSRPGVAEPASIPSGPRPSPATDEVQGRSQLVVSGDTAPSGDVSVAAPPAAAAAAPPVPSRPDPLPRALPAPRGRARWLAVGGLGLVALVVRLLRRAGR